MQAMSRQPAVKPTSASAHACARAQTGATLLELLVGVTLGIMVVGAALGTVVVSSRVTTSTGELAVLQQQASYAMHVIGRQLREAAALDAKGDTQVANPVITFDDWEAVQSGAAGAAAVGRDVVSVTRHRPAGASQPSVRLSVRTQAPHSVFDQVRDCLGNTVAASAAEIDSVFARNDKNELTCNGQPVIANVHDFQVRFRNIRAGTDGQPVIRLEDEPVAAADAVRGKSYVSAIDVCLEMRGQERVPDLGPADTYLNCHNQKVARGGTRRLVYRNVFNIRSDIL